MTQDFKDTLLKYLTGNLDEQTSSNTPQFGTVETIVNNLDTYVSNNISGTWEPTGREFAQGKDGNGNDLDLFILRGNENYNNNIYGFFVILNSSFQPIQIIKNFTSNVRIGEIGALKVDNSGNFYMVEYSVDNNKWRLVLLNNILMKLPTQNDYYCKIRISYNLPNSMQTFNSIDIFRSVTGNNYGIACITELSANGNLIVNNLKVEVGQPNEWTQYTYAAPSINYLDGYWSWTQDNYIFQFFGYSSSTNTLNKYYLNNSSISVTSFNLSEYGYTSSLIKPDVTVLNDTLFYIGISTDELSSGNFTGNQKYIILKCLNNVVSLIYQKENTTQLTSTWDRIVFYNKNGTVFFRAYYQDTNYFNLDIGLISNNNAYYFTIDDVASTQTSWYYAYKSFVVTMQFNIINYYVPTTTYNSVYSCQQIYNVNNYNGQQYENTNSLVPQDVLLFNDDEDPITIFARNLYNININGATTISTVEVPNTYLNDTTIANKSLISQTNTTMAYDITPITKNIYEVLDINFFNTLVMKNSNTATEIINYNGASRLNNSISQTNDYSNATANKIRINYQDDTSIIQNIGTPTITNGVATYTFSIYVPKGITNIEIISNDENTSYQTITGTFNQGSYYTLTQDVRVE